MEHWRYAVKDKSSLCQKHNYRIINGKGVTLYTDITVDELVKDGYEIYSSDEFKDLWQMCWAKYKIKICGKWKEITHKQYDDALNCLPPLKWTKGGFFLSELFNGDIGYFFQSWHGKFYESMQSINDQRNDILHELQESIKNGNVVALELKNDN